MSPELLLGAVLFVALCAYVVTAGADFGGGVWELFARGERAEAQHDTIRKALAPIWEANHVWLIVIIVVLFVCFPKSFAALMTVLHIPLTLMLIGIVLRGAAFAFRSYSAGDRVLEERSVRVFAVSSVVTPIMLGVSAGAVASGKIAIDDAGVVQTDFFSEWLAPFPFAVGVLLLAICAWLAAVYLAYEARADEDLCNDFVARSRWSGAAFAFVAAGTTLLASHGSAVAGAFASWRGVVAVSVVTGLIILTHVLQRRGRFGFARASAACAAVIVIAGWTFAQFPFLIPGELTLFDAAPRSVLVPVLWALAAGLVVVIPSFVWLFRVFDK